MGKQGKSHQRFAIVGVVLLILLSLTPPGYCGTPLHEDPGKVVSVSNVQAEVKLQNNLQEMMIGAYVIVYYINMSDYDRSRDNLNYFEDQLYNYKQQLDYSQISGSYYNRLVDSMITIGADLKTINDGSYQFRCEYDNFTRYKAEGDLANATSSAVTARDIYRELCKANASYASNSAIVAGLLNDTAIYTSPLNFSATIANWTLDGISVNMTDVDDLLSHTVLKLSTDSDVVRAGYSMSFFVALTTDSTIPADGQRVILYINNRYAGENRLSANGSCQIAYVVGDQNRTLLAQARLVPDNPGLAPAVSDVLPITVLDKDTTLSMSIAPSSASYGDTIRVTGTLAGTDGSKASGRVVSISLNKRPVSTVTTDDNGEYSLSIPVTQDTPGGDCVFRATYTRRAGSSDIYASSKVVSGNVYVATAETRLTITCPNRSLIGGDIGEFSGTLTTEGGEPVHNASVMIFDGSRLLGQNTTDGDGAYRALITMPYDIGTGDRSLYSMFQADNKSVQGSKSDSVSISFWEVMPILTGNKVPMVLFNDDMLYLNGTLLSMNNMPLAGQPITIYLSDTEAAKLETDANGGYEYRHKITYKDPAGQFDVRVVAPDNTYLAGSTYVLPYNKIAIILAAIVVPLVVLYALMVLTGIDRLLLKGVGRWTSRAAKGRRASATPLPEAPEQPAPADVLEMPGEIASLNAMIGDGNLKDALISVYALARRVARHYGNTVVDSSTHREFYWDMAAKYASVSQPLGDIINKYEVVNFGQGEVNSGEVDVMVDDLWDLYRAIGSQGQEESRP